MYLRPSSRFRTLLQLRTVDSSVNAAPPWTPSEPGARRRKDSADCLNYVHIFAKSGRFPVVTAQMLLRSHIFAVQRNCFHRRPFLSLSRGSGGDGQAAARRRVPGGFSRPGEKREKEMKKHLSIVLGATALGLASMAATPASAQIAGLSANAAVTTNYIFRGISQSGANPAVQAGLDYNIGTSGFAIGTW